MKDNFQNQIQKYPAVVPYWEARLSPNFLYQALMDQVKHDMNDNIL
jgi:hypothetical protein